MQQDRDGEKVRDILLKIKNIISKLEKPNNTNSELELVQELIKCSELYKKELVNPTKPLIENRLEELQRLNLKIEKVSEETFLYKPVTTKNYYEGDYLEQFCELRTSDLIASGVLEIHNRFWEAHEIMGGNIFATIPLELITELQSSKLIQQYWIPVQTDIFEIKNASQLSKIVIINTFEKMFENYLLIREVSGNIFMVLNYKL